MYLEKNWEPPECVQCWREVLLNGEGKHRVLMNLQITVVSLSEEINYYAILKKEHHFFWYASNLKVQIGLWMVHAILIGDKSIHTMQIKDFKTFKLI